MESEAITSILMQMEFIRLNSYEAETRAEVLRCEREYNRLWKIVEPMIAERDALETKT